MPCLLMILVLYLKILFMDLFFFKNHMCRNFNYFWISKGNPKTIVYFTWGLQIKRVLNNNKNPWVSYFMGSVFSIGNGSTAKYLTWDTLLSEQEQAWAIGRNPFFFPTSNFEWSVTLRATSPLVVSQITLQFIIENYRTHKATLPNIFTLLSVCAGCI